MDWFLPGLLWRRVCTCLLSLLSIFWLWLPSGLGALAGPAVEPPVERPALTATDLEQFLDPLLGHQLERQKIAGAVVSIVKDGQILFAKGYGYADVENRKPMNAERTVIRPGSISKLFTGIAVMQLVEQGRLDLDQDVNRYLDFIIPTPRHGKPVTLRRLISHRAGFEEHGKDVFSARERPLSLGPWLADALPKRLFPNGDVSAYSNYGSALAGYIVERVSGQPYDDYIETHILTPLGMTRSTMAQPYPQTLGVEISRGYKQSDQPPLPHFEVVTPAPAGALSATATDMAKFMTALLNGGSLDDGQILKPETWRQMTEPQTETAVGSVGLAFVTTGVGGHATVGHNGATELFNSNLLLLPEENFGFFISYNSAGVIVDKPVDVTAEVIKRYFGIIEVAAGSSPLPPQDLAKVGGTYQTTRRADSNFARIMALVQQAHVRPLSDGTIRLESAAVPGAGGVTLRPIAPFTFAGPDDLKVRFEPWSGTGLRLFIGHDEWHRVPWYLDARLVVPILVLALLLLVGALMSWPIMAVVRRVRQKPFGRTVQDRRDYRTMRVILAIDAGVVASFLGLLVVAMQSQTILNDALNPWLVALYTLAWLGALGAIAACWIAGRFWRGRVGGLWSRLHHSLLAFAAVTFAWFFITWRIAGATLNY